MWLEWLSQTLSAPKRPPSAAQGRSSRAKGTPERRERCLAEEAGTGGAVPAPLVSQTIVLEPPEPHRS